MWPATLGADVPFFLEGGTALGLGRGDEIYPLADLPRHWVVLLRARVRRLEPRGVRLVRFAERDLGRGALGREPQHVPGPWPSRAAQMINDLEAAIARHHPEIDQMKAALRRAGALASAMSGQRVGGVRTVSESSRGPHRVRPLVRVGLAGDA